LAIFCGGVVFTLVCTPLAALLPNITSLIFLGNTLGGGGKLVTADTDGLAV
jgi:hypothetical protein